MKKNKTEEIEFIIDENNRVDFRQVLQMINMYEEKIQKKQAIIDMAREYINTHLKQDMLSDFTGANYIQDYISDPDELLDILKEAQNEKN